MPKGGHARSGPPKQAGSRTSERAGYSLTALPAVGYDQDPPELAGYMTEPTGRHEAIWAELWRTPQACAWSLERWRWPVVADLTRWMVRNEDPQASAAVATAVRQLRDDLGLSFAGLRVNGWAIGAPELGEQPTKDEVTERRRRRLRDAQ